MASTPWVLLPSLSWLRWDLVGTEAGSVARTVPAGHIGGAARTGVTGAVHRGAVWTLREPWEKRASCLSDGHTAKWGHGMAGVIAVPRSRAGLPDPVHPVCMRGSIHHQVRGPPPSPVMATTDISQHRPGPPGTPFGTP